MRRYWDLCDGLLERSQLVDSLLRTCVASDLGKAGAQSWKELSREGGTGVRVIMAPVRSISCTMM